MNCDHCKAEILPDFGRQKTGLCNRCAHDEVVRQRDLIQKIYTMVEEYLRRRDSGVIASSHLLLDKLRGIAAPQPLEERW